ncbi:MULTISPECIES: PTS system mannose/fructose/N-acetylgalactosamine-transporter subunit IIB [Companilactobacillus]|jgi:PTS system mannose-specific IIB component|uniref:PTS sugar transporter subunit IIB n=1 Tax=Companilactobacillus pabuli TaxID=2714036 RepID=A0A7L7KYF1_9LACO|nr:MULTISPECIES: PTS sugar transporter subunit IIB [Companilactobacillus]AKP02634.1 PTS mannose transporter subunit IIAB [Companilactobacillus farciminis]AKS50931.1 PTS mannose transporter subunit IIAB [Companilactobacillus farciminis]MDG5114068.1 PTS sugar transporter subunit IIB [Companilactobacillus pabuli]QMT84817.1 PTS sugar transporter subunit IIB [Companilactobacillus pabuli]GAQ02409.1 PTS mannose transporter subunit IID [Companilactobacillus farciminis]
MGIIAVRIDERLIHGQVANLWTTKLQASRIMVVDNDIIKNDIQKTALKLAKPAGVNLSILGTKKSSANILAGKYESQRVFLVVKKPETLVQMIEEGVKFDTINVGNMSQKDNTQHLTQSINVTDEDYDAFHKILDAGVKITAQMVPNDDAKDFAGILKDYKK